MAAQPISNELLRLTRRAPTQDANPLRVLRPAAPHPPAHIYIHTVSTLSEIVPEHRQNSI
jgi:hypothetical protein